MFQRPLAWPEVVQAMDQLFAPADLDFDIEFEESGGPDTQPSQLEEPARRALMMSSGGIAFSAQKASAVPIRPETAPRTCW